MANFLKLNKSYLGPEVLSNGSFEGYGPELVTNGDFSSGLLGWTGNDIAAELSLVNDIILATSTHQSDTILVKIAKQEGINYFRGSLNNVVNRYYMCAKKFKLD